MDPVAQPAAASAAAPPPPPPAAAAPAAAGAPPPAAPAAGAVAAPAAQSPEPPKPAAPAAAPAKIEVKLRDGVKIDEKVLDEFRTIVSNEKLSPQERAQALIDLQFRAQDGNVKAVEAAITTQRNADLEALKADPQFGGARFEQTRNDARSVMKHPETDPAVRLEGGHRAHRAAVDEEGAVPLDALLDLGAGGVHHLAQVLDDRLGEGGSLTQVGVEGGVALGHGLVSAMTAAAGQPDQYQALAGVACRRRPKKYERPQSTPVGAAHAHPSGPSPHERWAMSAEARLMAKPA